MITGAAVPRGLKPAAPFLIVLLSISAGVLPVSAQTAEGPASSAVNPLATKEEMIRDRFQRLEDRIFRLCAELAETDPDNAARLERALAQAGELELADQLEQTIRLLRESAPLTEVLDAQARWIEEAEQLLDTLLRRESANEERGPQIDRLEAYRQEVARILDRQRALRDMSGEGPRAPRADDETPAAQPRSAQDPLEAAGRERQGIPTAALADEQRVLARDTGELAAQMKEDRRAGGQSLTDARAAAEPPGVQNVARAEAEMDNAAQTLSRHEPESAAPSQDQAIAELGKAQSELENALERLRQKEQAERLASLTARFREMLAAQRSVNDETLVLLEIGATKFTRAEHLQLGELAARENALAEQATACAQVLDEKSGGVVFPHVVRQLAEDMQAVSRRLAEFRVGPLTQTMQQEIVETLLQLLESLKSVEPQSPSGSGGRGDERGEGGKASLLPTSAELKLLRFSQLRVNVRTAAIEAAKGDPSESGEALQEALADTAARQAECAAIAKEMYERQNQPLGSG